MHLRCMTEYVRVKPSITCFAGYCAVHLLRKYTTILTTKKPLTESTSVKGESTFRGATLLHDNMRALSGY